MHAGETPTPEPPAVGPDPLAPAEPPPHPHHHEHPQAHSLLDAAIEAELRTPPREPTREAAKKHLLVRLARIVGGIIFIILGLVMMVTPGPGLVAIAAGLALLAEDVPFARRLLDQVRARIPETEDGKISPWVWVVTAVTVVAAVAGSVWWYVLR